MSINIYKEYMDLRERSRKYMNMYMEDLGVDMYKVAIEGARKYAKTASIAVKEAGGDHPFNYRKTGMYGDDPLNYFGMMSGILTAFYHLRREGIFSPEVKEKLSKVQVAQEESIRFADMNFSSFFAGSWSRRSPDFIAADGGEVGFNELKFHTSAALKMKSQQLIPGQQNNVVDGVCVCDVRNINKIEKHGQAFLVAEVQGITQHLKRGVDSSWSWKPATGFVANSITFKNVAAYSDKSPERALTTCIGRVLRAIDSKINS